MVGSSALKSDVGSGHPHLGQSGADRVLAGDEGRATGCATLLAVVVRKGYAFVGDAIDVWGSVSHLTPTVIADVPPADIVAPEDQYVRLFRLRHFKSPLIGIAFKLSVVIRSSSSGRYTKRSKTAKKANRPIIVRRIEAAIVGVCFPSTVKPAIAAKLPPDR